MYAPKNAPPEVAEKLTAAVKAALADPQVQARLDKAGIVRPRQVGPEVLKKKLAHEIEKWGDILRTTKDSD
jgi:tripartite-type tricarboxylate transporter receptor subunit TctC